MKDWFRTHPFHDYASAIAHLDRRSARVRNDAPLAHAVRLVRHFVDADSVSVVYHQTPIVTFWRNGTQTLHWGGWYTKTTFEHIERYARLGDLVIRPHNRDRHGRGEAVAWYLDRADWPRTPSRMSRCRKCKGTGRAAHAYTRYIDGEITESDLCFNCAGSCEIERGGQLIPELHCEAMLLTPAKGPFPQTVTIHPVDDLPTYECKCSVCRCGCGTWTQHWCHAQSQTAFAAKVASYGHTDQWMLTVTKYSEGEPVSVVTTPMPAVPDYLTSNVSTALADVLPGLRTPVPCPVCKRGERGTYSLSDQIVHLNDNHRWTREQVADWLESLDVDLAFPIPA